MTLIPILISALGLAPVPMSHQGEQGVWIRAVEAEAILLRLEALPDLEAYAEAQASLITAQRHQIEALRGHVDACDALRAVESRRLSEALELAESQAEALSSVWRSPWLWLAVGGLLGAGGAAAAAIAAR